MTVNRSGITKGFTLLEVMIAVTIFAAMAVVISGTTSQATDVALTLENKTLAGWVAENQLHQIRLEHSLPNVVGTEIKDEVSMANRDWLVKTKVEQTDFPNVVRVTVTVADPDNSDYQYVSMATIMGAYD